MNRDKFLDELYQAASHGRSISVTDDAGSVTTTPWLKLLGAAEVLAADLSRKGLERCRVAVVMSTSLELVASIIAVWLAGGSVSVFATGDPGESTRGLWRRVMKIAPGLVICRAEEVSVHEAGSPVPVPVPVLDARLDPPRFDSRQTGDGGMGLPVVSAIVQPTSGSTSHPRLVPVTFAHLRANLQAMTEASDLSGSDRFVSWLPLHHDMGLVGFTAWPLWLGAETWLLTVGRFRSHPQEWLQTAHAMRATVTGGPDFAIGLAAKYAQRGTRPDLSNLRAIFNGGEMIKPRTAALVEAARPGLRLDARAHRFVYGLAEATLAVTIPDQGLDPRFDVVCRASLEAQKMAQSVSSDDESARWLAVVGRPIGDVEVRAVNEVCQPLEDRHVGVIQIRGTSVVTAYDSGQPAVDASGWVDTGDLGYLVDGELVIAGRTKDIMTIAGRNIAPEEIELAVEEHCEVRAGHVVAFSVADEEDVDRIIVVAEVRDVGSCSLGDVRGAASTRLGLAVADFVALSPGAMPKTSSGKLQRALCRQRYLAGSRDEGS